MGKDDRSKIRSRGTLDPEDARLWRQVAGSAKPLRKGRNRAVALPEPPSEAEPPADPPKPDRPQKPAASPPSRPPKPPGPPPPAAFGRREARALGTGKTAIDARLDLHGHRQREAHTALKAFLARAQAQGHRHVLVITGKGGRAGEEGGFSPGVLAREVPRWLGEPGFREYVVSFAPAHRRHGGEGALYVRVRRAKRA